MCIYIYIYISVFIVVVTLTLLHIRVLSNRFSSSSSCTINMSESDVRCHCTSCIDVKEVLADLSPEALSCLKKLCSLILFGVIIPIVINILCSIVLTTLKCTPHE